MFPLLSNIHRELSESVSETIPKTGFFHAGHWRYLLLGAVVVGNLRVLARRG
jgi:hypothetical protein